MLRRPRQNHRVHTIMVLSKFRKFQFSEILGKVSLTALPLIIFMTGTDTTQPFIYHRSNHIHPWLKNNLLYYFVSTGHVPTFLGWFWVHAHNFTHVRPRSKNGAKHQNLNQKR